VSARELAELVDAVIGWARAGELVEAYGVEEAETTVRAHAGRAEALTSARTRGIGVRVIDDARLGYAHTADLSKRGLASALDDARRNATAASPDPGNVLPEAAEAETLDGLYDDAFERVSPEEKVEAAVALEAATLAAAERVRGVRTCQYGDAARSAVIASTTGLRAAYRRADAFVLVEALAEDDGSSTSAYGLDYGRHLGRLDIDAAAREAAGRATGLLGGRKPRSGRLPVLLDPFATASLLGVVAGALTAEAVQKGRSLFADRLGESLAGAHVTLVDDGRRLDAPGSAPWDGEGVPTGRTVLLEGGVLQGWLHNTATAARAGAASTGNASRAGHKSPPGVSPSNLYLEPGREDRDTLFAQAGTAFYCQQIMGLHSGANPVTGEISVAAAGRMVRDGSFAEAVREATIAGTVPGLLSGLRAVGSDLRFLPIGGSIGGATLLVDGLTVSGT
jgi:PmbA protein